MIKKPGVNSIQQIVDKTINKRLAPVLKVQEKSNFNFITEEEAIEMLRVSPSTFLYYRELGLLNSIVVLGVMTVFEHRYKLSEVLALNLS